jgi:hypothetical protein
MIKREDLIELESILDDRYVLKIDCDSTQKEFTNKLANDDKRIDIIIHDFKIIKWLLTVLAGASGGSLISDFIELFAR